MLYIKREVIHQFDKYSKSLIPNEACGLLISYNHSQIIDTFISIPNTSTTPYQFNFEPKIFIKTLQQIKNNKGTWLGVIHSHPSTTAYPSSIDIANWYYPNLSYWIYSLKDEELKAYLIKEKNVISKNYFIK
ncbi:hypothetical protein BHF71_02085 [Vulcanibacillus modesticaldus]|uniref:JAB1/MPN/MOV34 metalloenzyme domain-containing protein n=1 Tax=Vulcanibacillus modesticaldus TaxID=337097 RepID=A0A1D2YUT2_9BACI|nr:M67 family metallopeptidase [Vulcanibacillus modesticaldus]OEF99396.1 hypothetical protein BHF71_02085 [Vulcanibacillus modesticaldus]